MGGKSTIVGSSSVWTHLRRNYISSSKFNYCNNVMTNGTSTVALWIHIRKRHPILPDEENQDCQLMSTELDEVEEKFFFGYSLCLLFCTRRSFRKPCCSHRHGIFFDIKCLLKLTKTYSILI